VIVVPPLYVASDALLERLDRFVQNGGHLVVAFKSGFTNEYSTVRWSRMPGPLRKAAGFSYQEFSTLRNPIPLKGDPFRVGENNRVSAWAELLIPETAQTLATYDHPFFGKYAAITRNSYGKGTLTYEGAALSDELQRKVILQTLELAKLAGPEQKLPDSVRVKRAFTKAGKPVHIFLNYSSKDQDFSYSYAAGSDMLAGKEIAPGAPIKLAPWDCAIIEER